MIKKITLTSLILCLLISCGKKGSPKYIDPADCLKYQNPDSCKIFLKMDLTYKVYR